MSDEVAAAAIRYPMRRELIEVGDVVKWKGHKGGEEATITGTVAVILDGCVCVERDDPPKWRVWVEKRKLRFIRKGKK